MIEGRVLGAVAGASALVLIGFACNSSDVTTSGGGGSGSGTAGSGTAGSGSAGSGSGGSGSGGTGGGVDIIGKLPDAGDAGGRPVTVNPDGRNCYQTDHSTARMPPNVILALDRSGSMTDNKVTGPVCQTRTCGTRWEEVTAALKPALEATKGGINWGLRLFPDNHLPAAGSNRCFVSPGVTVPTAPNNANAVVAGFAAPNKGLTPTRAAVQQASEYLKKLTSPNPKAIVLATDGEPNCANPNSETDDRPAAIAMVKTTATSGIPVYVVGISTTKAKSKATMNAMALAGGQAKADPGCKPNPDPKALTDEISGNYTAGTVPMDPAKECYYAANTKEEFAAAMTAIAAEVATCTFTMEKVPPVPDNVLVQGDGVTIPRDATNGWEYADAKMTALQLHGKACEDAKSGKIKDVKITFGCPGVPIL